MQTVAHQKLDAKRNPRLRDKAIILSSISKKRKRRIRLIISIAMRSSVICRYHTQSLVVTKNTLQIHISEPSKTCFSRFSKMMSLYLDVQIYPYFNKGQTQDNNYTLRQQYEQTMNKECVYLYLNQLSIFDKVIFYLLSPESITNKIKFNFQNKYEMYVSC